MKEHVHSKEIFIFSKEIFWYSYKHTSHFFNRTHGWKLTSSSNFGLTKNNVKLGIPLNLTQQSI